MQNVIQLHNCIVIQPKKGSFCCFCLFLYCPSIVKLQTQYTYVFEYILCAVLLQYWNYSLRQVEAKL